MHTIPTTPMPDGGAMPVFGLGTWGMGERADAARTEIAALRHAMERGVTLLDTAEMYGSGGSERVVGEAVRGKRDGMFIVSKVLPTNASRAGTIAACERSLRNLSTDRIDLYLLHWPGSHKLAETVDAFETLRDAGKIGAWGVSNFDTEEMDELEAIAPGCTANQVLYNLTRRGVEYDLAPWLARRTIPLMAYSPIEQARLLRNPALGRIAEAHGATPAQIALAFLLAQPNVVVIPKSSRPKRIDENLGALEVELTQADLAALDEAFPPPTRKTGLEML